jgi:CHAT domain-containing protein
MDFRESVGGMYYDLADVQLRLADHAADPEHALACVLEARQAVELFKTAELVDYFRDRCIQQVRTDVQQIESVAPDTAVVYVIPLPDRTEIILSLASGLRRFKVDVGSQELMSEVRLFRRRLEDRTSHRYRPCGQKLYGWLIQPVEQTLAAEGVTTLVFVPDGALRTIPMAALHDGERFLVERYAVAVVPGLTLVAPRPFRPEWRAALMCGITEAVAGFSALTYVGSELDQIETLSGGRCLRDDAFRLPRVESEVSSRPPGVLHIASHGQFSADPSETFVLTHDGKLSLDELEMLIRPGEFRGKPVELLTLSACETAAGDDRAALGLAGVALKAGARSAMATLWYVNDEASAHIVSGFYRNLCAEPGNSKAQALRQSQCAVMGDRRFRHPCYWAPYLIIGNWL